MGQAIGQVLALAVGVAISPVAIIGVVLMLVTPRARTNGPAFLLGWLLGLSIIGAIVLLVAPDAASDTGAPATWVNWLKLLLGVLLVLLALKDWRGRPRDGEEAPTPRWMGAIDGFGATKSLEAGVVLSAANPKNLLLAVAAAASIAQTAIPGGEQAVVYAVFVLIGAIGVAVPLVIYFALGERASPILQGIKAWMALHNAVIVTVLFLVIGAKLIGEAISGSGG
jgi:threonine/homoserine/homoserine lactone efflux protein